MWIRRVNGEPAPWTDDATIAGGKFTNIFRELDRGTIALRRAETFALKYDMTPEDLVFNVCWYRMLNRVDHLFKLGLVTDIDDLTRYVDKARPLFTAAHQTWLPRDCGPGDGVRRAYNDNFKLLWDRRHRLTARIQEDGTLAGGFEAVKGVVPGVGPFIAYEIVTDLRRTLLCDAPDAMTWCNISKGGGSARGLRRLGYDVTVTGAVALLDEALDRNDMSAHLSQHLPLGSTPTALGVLPLLELREIEHALCEFDKYERVRSGLGKTRGGRYDPTDKTFDDGGFGAGLKVRITPTWSGSR